MTRRTEFGYSDIRRKPKKTKETEFGDNRPKPLRSVAKKWNLSCGNHNIFGENFGKNPKSRSFASGCIPGRDEAFCIPPKISSDAEDEDKYDTSWWLLRRQTALMHCMQQNSLVRRKYHDNPKS
jgi:hypothetical protein